LYLPNVAEIIVIFFLASTSKVTFKSCFEITENIAKKEKADVISNHIQDVYGLYDIPDHVKTSLLKSARFILMKITKKWNECHQTKNTFLSLYSDWLETEVKMDDSVLQYMLEPRPGTSGTCRQKGRPEKDFSELSTPSKKRRVDGLLKNTTRDELEFAAGVLRKSVPPLPSEESKSLSTLQALALYSDLGLSVRKYNILRTTVNNLHKDMFPSYYTLKKFRNQRLPSDVNVSDSHAQVNLQQLCIKTAEVIMADCVDKQSITNSSSIKLLCKWGFDGSSGHSLYKQKFGSPEQTDEYVFLMALVPLHVIDRATNKILWNNPNPSSVLYCRPIKFIFVKETPTLVTSEKNDMDIQINNLVPHIFTIDGVPVEVIFELLFTMIDGSICNIISGTNSTQTCYICGCTPKDMNKEVSEKHQPNPAVYKFGLSTLHCIIRSFECLLHISYRLGIKTWQVRGEESKNIFAETKARIQREFKEKMGLIVDKPKPGFGSTNDGNTARRFLVILI
jgi:hypothetical protein